MLSPYEINLFIYNIVVLPVIFLSMVYYFMVLLNFGIKIPRLRFRNKIKKWPFVTIQLPVYNDPVVGRCIKTCLNLDYPKDRYEIVVADDSTDEKTKKIIDSFKGKIKIVRRNNRKGFKAGALNNAMKYSRGEIIVVFDSDWVPPKNFLKRIVKPFLADNKIAGVQGRIKVINKDLNLVTKFASALLLAYYRIWVPLQHKAGATYLGGTAMALRRDVLEEVGGWNENSLTEDADLTVNLLKRGYKILYMGDLKAGGEVPYNLFHFLKQQARWAYGQARVFVEHWRDILFSKTFNIKQKLIIFLTSIGGNLIAPFVVLMTLTGQLGWVLGPMKPFELQDFYRFVFYFVATGGFLAVLGFTLKKENLTKDFPSVFFGAMTIGVLLAITNSIAAMRALLGMKMVWFKTPKWGDFSVLKIFKVLFSRNGGK